MTFITRDLIPFGSRSSLSRSVFDEMDRALNSVFGRDFFPSALSKSNYPKMNVYDHDGNLCVDAYVPEVPKEKIDIKIEDGILTMSGGSEKDQKLEEGTFYCRELSRRSFSRSIKLPDEVDLDKVSAEHKDGMLKIKIPYTKLEEVKNIRKVNIA